MRGLTSRIEKIDFSLRAPYPLSEERGALERALETLGAVLEDRGERFEVFVIGGGSLLLTGFIQRPTQDIDVVAMAKGTDLVSAHPLPGELVAAVEDVASLYGLAKDWLNAGPTALLDLGLPSGFRGRTKTQAYGGLLVHHAGRIDQVFFKLYATVDTGPRSKHAQDLQRLKPTPRELLDAARWSRTHDPSEPFESQLLQVLAWLGVDDADA
ncbi:MAG: hypothetical protein JKY37_03160 [Nannocystaceae bacterium]|nr:hypothetical protein [Nannocystaceae bacterium]